MTNNFQIRLTSLPPLDELARAWTELEARCAGSFFTSWSWIGSWLTALPQAVRPQWLRVEREGQLVGTGLLARRRVLHGQIIPVRTLLLHETGRAECDAVFIEHNGLLVEPFAATEVWPAVLEFLICHAESWDELHLSGLEGNDPLVELAEAGWAPAGAEWQLMRDCPCCQIDLSQVRKSTGEYLGQLSANSRSQIRRACKLYAEQGPLDVHAAADLTSARQYFQELCELHSAYWNRRGEPGAFSTPFSRALHEQLLSERFEKGDIQLLRVAAGSQLLGYLYNFLHRGHVLNYQSGFNYGDNAKLKPGLVSHALAVEYNLHRGALVYDFLAGESQYKRMLSTAAGRMVWYVLRRDRLRFRLEKVLKSMKRRALANAATLRRIP